MVALIVALVAHYTAILPSNADTFVLSAITLVAVTPVVWRTALALKKKTISIDLLVIVALFASLIAKELVSAVFISLMLTSSRILALSTEDQARRAIQSLLKLKPQKVRVKHGDRIEEISPENVQKGDIVVVELGERVPVDGTITNGTATVDQSSLTGESLPLEKKGGDSALSSTLVVSGNLEIRAEKVGKETALEKIIELVEKSEVNKSKISTFSDNLAIYYSIVVVLGTALIYFYTHNLALILSVILIVSAEDIAIAIPLAFVAAIGHAAKRGAVIKGGNYLEALRRAKVLVVDKTGTLTKGKLKIENVFTFGDMDKKRLLSLVAPIAAQSNHPAAIALLQFVETENPTHQTAHSFEEQSGRGMQALVDGIKVMVGRQIYLEDAGIMIDPNQLNEIVKEEENGANVTLVGCDGKLAGFFTLLDEIKPGTKEILTEMKQLGVSRIVMLSGDNEKIAARVAKEVGITDFHADLLPENKITYLKKYLHHQHTVIAAGDGVNDAALLSAADIGVAMGGIGAETTIESADIVLMQDDLAKLPELIKLSRFTIGVAYEDLAIWAAVNALGLYLVFSGILLPTGAAIYNFAGDFPPLLNSIRLLALHKKAAKKGSTNSGHPQLVV